MENEAPSWADQWGAGGIGAIDDEKNSSNDKDGKANKKGDAKAGLNKAKAAAMIGAQKIKIGATSSFKWVKNKCQKKDSSSK